MPVQDLNVIPFPLVAANCGGWVSYAIVARDPFIFFANAPGRTSERKVQVPMLTVPDVAVDICVVPQASLWGYG